MSSTSFETWLCARHHARCYMSDSRVQVSKQQVHKKSCMLWGGHSSNTPGAQRTGGKFTFKWESREVFLGKAMMKLDLKGGCNLDIGSRMWKKPFVWVSLQDPLEGQSGSWLPQGQLLAVFRNFASHLSASPHSYFLKLEQWWRLMVKVTFMQCQACDSTIFFLAHRMRAEEAPQF